MLNLPLSLTDKDSFNLFTYFLQVRMHDVPARLHLFADSRTSAPQLSLYAAKRKPSYILCVMISPVTYQANHFKKTDTGLSRLEDFIADWLEIQWLQCSRTCFRVSWQRPNSSSLEHSTVCRFNLFSLIHRWIQLLLSNTY